MGYAPGAEFEAQIPAEHEGGDQGVKGVEQPDWAQRQPGQVKPEDEVATVAEADVTQAVGGEIMGGKGFPQHG